MIVNWYFIGKMVDCRNSVFIVKGLDVIVSYGYIFGRRELCGFWIMVWYDENRVDLFK